MWSRRVAAVVVAGMLVAGPALAVDEEGCLICHRLDLRKASGGPSLKVSDLKGTRHESLYCSDCHTDAKTAPHPAPPGPAGCVGACHSSSQGAADSHRRASYGGLTESHRKISAPKAPCLLCHAAGDPAGRPDGIDRRCGSCHPGERESIARGVHHRIRTRAGGGMCAACHAAHRPAAKGPGVSAGKATCDGTGCHARVTEGMRRLGGHGAREPAQGWGGRAAEAGVFLSIAALGALAGRVFCRDGAGRGAKG